MTFTDKELSVLRKVLCSDALQLLIGAEEWDLTEAEEELLWQIISRFDARGIS